MESYNFPYVVPQLVEDNSLKRARTTITEGGEEKEAIRVTSVGGNGNLDSQGVADAMATAPEATVDVSSVLGKIAQLNSNLSLMNDHLGEISEAVYDPEESGTLLDNVQNNTAYTYDTSIHTDEINNKATAINTAIGSKSDAQWSSPWGDGSLIALGKKTAADTNAIVSYASDLRTTNGFTSDSAWSGSGNGSLNAIAKRTSNDAHAAAGVLGTTSDPVVIPGNSGSINGRLRHISAGLDDIGYAVVNINTNTGTSSSTAWTGSGSGTLISVGKRTSNDTHSTSLATGTQSDAAWSGTGDGSVIALLKGIYNKL